MKGFEIAPYMIGALILLLLAITFVWGFWSGALSMGSKDSEETILEGCRRDEDCENNLDGPKCLMIYPGEFTLACHCVYHEDCENRRSGFCEENKCV